MIVVFKVVDALVFFGTIILFSFICCFFLIQTSTNVFAGYKNSALMRSAPIPKVHAIAHANMDSREMDENVKVGVAFISSYVRKKKSYICKLSTKGMITYISILSARKCKVKVNATGKYMDEITMKILLDHQSVFSPNEINLLITFS